MSFRVDEKRVMKDYTKLKVLAESQIRNRDINTAMKIIGFASDVMHQYNIILKDNELEEQINNISCIIKSHNGIKLSFTPLKGKIIFYDYFAVDFRNESLQYLKALCKLGYEILYIIPSKRELKNNSKILNEINSYSKATLYQCINSRKVELIVELTKVISGFRPEKVLVQTTHSDLPPIITIRLFEKLIESFMIDISDHAFWLGTSIFNFFLESRNHGYNIARINREIDQRKLIILPYYPIVDNSVPFQGLDCVKKDRKIIFSGGYLNKIYGSTLYFELVKKILSEYKNVILLYAGNGDSSKLVRFIDNNKLYDQFFYTKERYDFIHLMNKCYFFLNTFPLAGGLMSQYAVCCGKIPLGLKDENLPAFDFESVLLDTKDYKYSFSSVNELCNEIGKLLSDDSYRLKRESQLTGMVISPQTFTDELYNALEKKENMFTPRIEKIDITKEKEQYFYRENNVLKSYRSFFVRQNCMGLSLEFPGYFVAGAIKKIRTKYRQ